MRCARNSCACRSASLIVDPARELGRRQRHDHELAVLGRAEKRLAAPRNSASTSGVGAAISPALARSSSTYSIARCSFSIAVEAPAQVFGTVSSPVTVSASWLRSSHRGAARRRSAARCSRRWRIICSKRKRSNWPVGPWNAGSVGDLARDLGVRDVEPQLAGALVERGFRDELAEHLRSSRARAPGPA